MNSRKWLDDEVQITQETRKRELGRILAQDEVTQSDETIETETMKNEAARKRHNGEQAQQIIVEKENALTPKKSNEEMNEKLSRVSFGLESRILDER